MDYIKKYLGNKNISVSEAMQLIDQNSSGILFLVDEGEHLFGCITDGDIRRYLLSSGKMDDEAIRACNTNPRVADTTETAQELFDSKFYKIIPIVDKSGRITDLYGDSELFIREKASLNIPVVINAGGKGTRLDPYTRILPKPLIPVGDNPIIEHIMMEYNSYDCKDFHIIVNYKKELIKAYFAENERKYNISWYEEQKPLGTGGGLSLLKGQFNDTFFFANCDVLLTANYEGIMKFHKENQNVITMVCSYKNINIPYGVVQIGMNGKIESLKEKPLISFLANTGIYVVEPEVIDDIECDKFIDFPDIVELERKKGKKVAAYPVSENEWMDMGQLPELEKMRIKLYGN